jgi:hypothetical protein
MEPPGGVAPPGGDGKGQAPAGRFILHVVGCARFAAGMVFTVFQPKPVCSESYFTPLVKTAA